MSDQQPPQQPGDPWPQPAGTPPADGPSTAPSGQPWAAPDAAYPGTTYLPPKRNNAWWIVGLVLFVLLVPCFLGVFGLGLFALVFNPSDESTLTVTASEGPYDLGADASRLAVGDCLNDSFLAKGGTIADGGMVELRSCDGRHRWEVVGFAKGLGDKAFGKCIDQVAALDAPFDLSPAAYAVRKGGKTSLVCLATRTDGKPLRAPLT